MNDGCAGDDSRLAAWIDDELAADQKRALAAHILLCPACAREVGHIAAHKALLPRADTAEEPPRDLWPSLRAELDRVDGVQRALSPAPEGRRSLLPVLAAAGLVLILGACYLRSHLLSYVGTTQDQLLAIHGQALEASGLFQPTEGALHAVANSYTPQLPHVAWQAVGRLNGEFAVHRVCLAGRLPVSVISTPAGALTLDGLERRVVAGRVIHVGRGSAGAVVVIQQQGLCHYIVANTTLEDLMPVAEVIFSRPTLLLP